MTNILLESYSLDAPWLRHSLAPYLRRRARAAVIAFSFRDKQVQNESDWNRLYSPNGLYYSSMVRPFGAYGIPEENVAFVNYFADTPAEALEKIERADILYFPGGLPDRMTERIHEFGLESAIQRHNGVILGYSAGAMIQFGEYHISPDDDYPEFCYKQGLGLINGFYPEVHYEGADAQNNAVNRVLAERGKPVFATFPDKSALIVENGCVRAIGETKIFLP